MAGIFRAYDIRGIYPSQVNEEIFFKIAAAYANSMNHSKKVIVGRDARLSSPSLRTAVVHGLRAAGKDVVDIGIVPTPVLYYSMFKLRSKAGLMITASHLPKEYNGIKLERDHAMGFTGERGIYRIEEAVNSGRLKLSKKHGTVKHNSVNDAYISHIAKMIKLNKKLKIVIDSGNGVCGEVSERLFRKLGCKVTMLYKEPDGRFPNHIADPHEYKKYHSMDALVLAVKRNKADLGIAYDGDGDRVGFVDDKGALIQEEHSILLFARQALDSARARKIIVDVRASDKLIRSIKDYGGIVKLTRAGHSYIEMRTLREQAIFAGETSGHFFFPYCYYPFDDGIFASAKFAEIVSRVDKISALIDTLPKMNITPEIRVNYPDDKKFDLIKRLRKYLRAKGYSFIAIDGVRIRLKNGWALIRASNTAPQITMRFEGDTNKSLQEIKKKTYLILRKFKVKV